MAPKPLVAHALGFIAVTSVALLSLQLLFWLVFRVAPAVSRTMHLSDLYALSLFIAIIPMMAWLIPPLVRGLAKGGFRLHQALKGSRGFYVQLPPTGSPRFIKTLGMALAPFSINLLMLAQILYLKNSWDSRILRTSFIAFSVLAGLVTSLPPGVWLLEALNLRFVDTKTTAIAPVSELFQRFLGPAGGIAALGSFIVLLHTAGYSYEFGILLLFTWMAALFPPILGATSVYRLAVEPWVLPKLRRWCGGEGIGSAVSLEEAVTPPSAVATE